MLQLISFSMDAFQAEAGSGVENVFRRKPEAVRKMFSGGSRKRGGKCFQAEAGSEAENVFRFRPDGTQDKDLPVENRKEEI